ncbi:MAG TPA: TonB-dependent receptor, partial [Flavisolibacter sp.]
MRKIFVVAAIVYSSPLIAQDSSSIHSKTGDHPLDRVVVTTNKYPKKQSQTGKVVTVIDRQLLDKMGSRTVGEILNTVAGTTISGANNNLGTNQRISTRGASDGNTLILVDGVPVNDPSVITNYFDLNFFNPAQIERIEVLKGGQSTLYGSDAVAGVINIITKKSSGEKFSPYASIKAGSFQTFQLNAGARAQLKNTSFHISGSQVHSKGFSSAYDSIHATGHDRDGFNQSVFRGDVSVKLSRNWNWNLSAGYSRYKADIDAAAFTNDNDFTALNRNTQLGTGFSFKHGNGTLRANYHFNHIYRFYSDDSVDKASFAYYSKSNYTGRTHFAELYESYHWKKFSLLAGMDYRYYNTSQDYHSISMFGPYGSSLGDTARMWQWSPYVSLVYHHKDLNIEAGTRWNHHNVYGNNFTYTFNPSYFIQKKLKVFANLSSAFKTPSLYQLFEPFIGNTQLDPENSLVFEGGLELYLDKLFIRVTDFYRSTDNAIQFIITDPVFFSGKYLNVNNQQNYGAEVELGYRPGKWNINANYTYTKGRTTSLYSESGTALTKDTTYNNLYRVPEHAFNLFAGYQAGPKLSFSTIARYAGSRLEPLYASAPEELNPYFTIDLSGFYKF